MSPQPLLDRNGWYPVGLDYAYLSPNVLSAIVNYRHNRFNITPGVTFNEGQLYGNPADVLGIDPRTCTSNSCRLHQSPIHTRIPLQADYTTCGLAATQNGTSPGELFIPNPQTGVFDDFRSVPAAESAQLQRPDRLSAEPALKANLLLANLRQRVLRRIVGTLDEAVPAE